MHIDATIDAVFTSNLQHTQASARGVAFAIAIDFLLEQAPLAQRHTLRDLSDWLLCCKNLWPNPANTEVGRAAPFSIGNPFPSLRVDPDAVRRTIAVILDDTTGHAVDNFLAEKIRDCVAASDQSDWRDLQSRSDPTPTITAMRTIAPSDAPADWPTECLVWAIRTMQMEDADLRAANLRFADLRGVFFENTDLSGADLRESNLSNALLRRCDLRNSKLDHANMICSTLIDNDLSKASLPAAQLPDASVTGCNLQRANLHAAILTRADARNSDMRHAILDHAQMQQIDLRGTLMRHASLKHTDLSFADISHTGLRRRDYHLSGAILSGAAIDDYVDGATDNTPEATDETAPTPTSAPWKTLVFLILLLLPLQTLYQSDSAD